MPDPIAPPAASRPAEAVELVSQAVSGGDLEAALAQCEAGAVLRPWARDPGGDTDGVAEALIRLMDLLRRGIRHRIHRVIQPLIGPHRGDGHDPVASLAVPAQPLMTHVRGLGAVLAVPGIVDHQHPAAMRRGRRVRQQQLQPARVDPPGSHRDSDRKNCSRCTAGCCAPATGSAPASAVSVLFRSRGASSPARYSRNPRRCAKEPNKSSNRAAYSSSGPGAAGHGKRRVITHLTAGQPLLISGIPRTRSKVNKLPLAILRRSAAVNSSLYASAYSAIYRRVGPERGLHCVIGARPGRACKYNCQAEGLNVYAARATGFRWDGCTSHHGQHAQPVYPDRPMAYQLAF